MTEETLRMTYISIVRQMERERKWREFWKYCGQLIIWFFSITGVLYWIGVLIDYLTKVRP